MAAKFVYFSNAGDEDAVNDIACYPVEAFRGFAISASDAVSLGMYFERIVEGIGGGDDEPFDLVDLVIESGTAKTVCKDVAEAIAHSKQAFITIADDTNSEYISTKITSVSAITPGT